MAMKPESEDEGGNGGLPEGFFRMGSITFRGNPDRRREIEARLREREEAEDEQDG